MNKDRRADIAKAVAALQSAAPFIETAKSIIEDAASGEREYYDNMHDNLKGGEKGEKADTAATALEEVQSTLEELDIDDLVSKLEEASE